MRRVRRLRFASIARVKARFADSKVHSATSRSTRGVSGPHPDLGATVNGTGALLMRADRVGRDTMLSQPVRATGEDEPQNN